MSTLKPAMKSVLHIGAVVDSHTPAAWIIRLLKNIDEHELMQLDVTIQLADSSATGTSGLSDKYRLDNWLLHKVIDFPHFSHDPWKPGALPATMIVDTLKPDQIPDHNVLHACDVILDLTASSALSHASAPVWSANLAVLDQRIKYCLLDHAPFIWIHLWEKQVSEKQVSERQVSEKQVSEKQVSEKQVSERQVSERQVSEKQLSERQNREKQNGEKQNWRKQNRQPGNGEMHDRRVQNQSVQSGKDESQAERVASHALPCQTYSISDLQRLTYSALPNFFLSRLIWLANSTQRKLDSVNKQASNQGVFDVDQQLAAADAVAALNAPIDVTTVQHIINTAKALRVLTRKTCERLHHKLFSEHWQLGVAYETDFQPPTMATICQRAVHTYETVETPADVIWADPHLCEYEGEAYVFFERMKCHNEHGHIAYARLDKQGKPVDTGVALSADHHLSFPFIFHHDNDVYMIPETASQCEVCLYKAVHFPDQWAREHVLLEDINAADTILLQHDERWWMFTNCQSHRSVDERDELHIFFADTLQGPWQSHALNPVITGVDRSRMAGPIIEENGNLYRISQYGAFRYGYGINISRIDELTPTTYKESASWRILPEKGAGWSGCHSFTRAANLVMIDRVRFSRT